VKLSGNVEGDFERKPILCACRLSKERIGKISGIAEVA
jgi:hypothetical protein